MCGIAHINEKELGIAAFGSRDGPKVTLSDRHAHCMREVIVLQVDRQVSRLHKSYAFEYLWFTVGGYTSMELLP